MSETAASDAAAAPAASRGDHVEAVGIDDSLHGTRCLMEETISAPSGDRLQVSLENLIFRRRIGAGAAGVTYLATWQGSTVAVKIANGGTGIDGWKREVRALHQLRHPNIVHVLGIICEKPPSASCSSTARAATSPRR